MTTASTWFRDKQSGRCRFPSPSVGLRNLASSRRFLGRAFQGLFILTAVLGLSACIGTTTASTSSNYNRQISADKQAARQADASPAAAKTAAGGAEAASSSSTGAQADVAPLQAGADLGQDGSGLIDQFGCVKGLTGDLATGRAGQILLLASGLNLDGDDTVPSLAGSVTVPLIMAENVSGTGPAPSAGASEAPQDSSAVGKIQAASLGQTEGLLVTAYQQAGRRYQAGGQNPGTGFDSAGFTRWVYGQRGILLPQGVKQQAAGGRQVAKESLRPGDLLVYRDAAKADEYYVGIYTGQGNFLHASPKSGVVTETAAFGPQFSPYFVGGRRYYDDPKAAPLSDSRKMAATSSAVKLALSELGPNDKPDRPTGKSKAKKKKK